MKINTYKPEKIDGGTSSPKRSEQRTPSAQTEQSQQIDSGLKRSEYLRNIQNSINDAPDVRSDLVKHIKAKIVSGEYQIDEGKLADNLLKSSLDEDIEPQG